MLQHASLDSSSCIGEIFGALLAGACVCIPSEGDATDGLAKFIKEFQVTCMSLWLCELYNSLKLVPQDLCWRLRSYLPEGLLLHRGYLKDVAGKDYMQTPEGL